MSCRKCGQKTFLVQPAFEVTDEVLVQSQPMPSIVGFDEVTMVQQGNIWQSVPSAPPTKKVTTSCPHVTGHFCITDLQNQIKETCGKHECTRIQFYHEPKFYERFVLFYYHMSMLPAAAVIMLYFIITAFAMANGVYVASLFFVLQYSYFVMNKTFKENQILFVVPILTSLVLNYWKPEWYMYFYTMNQKTTLNTIIWNVLWLIVKIFVFMDGVKMFWTITIFNEETYRKHMNGLLLSSHYFAEHNAWFMCIVFGVFYYSFHAVAFGGLFHFENLAIGAGFLHTAILFLFNPRRMINFKMF